MRERITIGFAGCMVLIFLPYILTLMISGLTGGAKQNESIASVDTGRTVSIEHEGSYDVIDVEAYLLGVLPGITDPECGTEVWKALAVMERTNIYRQMGGNTTVDEADLVEDYLTQEEIRSLWGERQYQRRLKEVEQAILATVGQTMTYDGEYITAYYHRVSDGKTVSAEELMGQAVPYLVSVDSGRDVESKNYMNLILIPKDELPTIQDRTSSSIQDQGTPGTEVSATASEMGALSITQATEHGYVQEVSVGGESMSADDFCRKYQIPSYHFYIEDLGDEQNAYRIVALGMGHGMGLSIYGAGVMNREGSDYRDILQHYFPGTQIS